MLGLSNATLHATWQLYEFDSSSIFPEAAFFRAEGRVTNHPLRRLILKEKEGKEHVECLTLVFQLEILLILERFERSDRGGGNPR